MRFIDYYQVMGLKEDASADEIKKAYRRLARKYHPDVSKEPNAEDKFKELGEAYEVLKDPQRRTEYDELKRYGGRTDEFAPPPGWQPRGGQGFENAQDAQRFSEFFEAIFGRGAREGNRGARGQWAGEDVHHALAVTLEEAHQGGTRMLSLGSENAAVPTKTLKVTIPKGIIDGRQIRLKGQGHPGVGGGRDGDLYLHVKIAPHRLFTVEEQNLNLILPVAPWELVLGAVVPVPTLDGPVKLTIPERSSAGRKLRLAGKGLGNPPGDLYVVLKSVVPTTVTERELTLYADLASESRFNPRESLGG
jgi:curved DNA-binding protein